MDSTGVGATVTVSAQPVGTCSETPAQACIGRVWRQQYPAASENEMTSPISRPRKQPDEIKSGGPMQSHCSVGELEGYLTTDSNEAGGYVGSIGPPVIQPGNETALSCGEAVDQGVTKLAPALSTPYAGNGAVCEGAKEVIMPCDSSRGLALSVPCADDAAISYAARPTAVTPGVDSKRAPANSVPCVVDDGALSVAPCVESEREPSNSVPCAVDDGDLSIQVGPQTTVPEQEKLAESAPCVDDGALSTQGVMPCPDSAISDAQQVSQDGDNEVGGKRMRVKAAEADDEAVGDSRKHRGRAK
eukprot:gene14594-20644_t